MAAVEFQAKEESFKAKAVSSYPELGVAGSPMNLLFVARVNELKLEQRNFFNTPDWPMRLAAEIHKLRTSSLDKKVDSLEVSRQPALYIGRWVPVVGTLNMAKGSSIDSVIKLELEGGIRCEVAADRMLRACNIDPSKEKSWDFQIETRNRALIIQRRTKDRKSDIGGVSELLTLEPGKKISIKGQLKLIDGKLVLQDCSILEDFVYNLR